MSVQGEVATKRFRWWGWVAPAPFALLAVMALVPGNVAAALFLLAMAVPLALTGIRPAVAPWWSLLGWTLAMWGAVSLIVGGANAAGAVLLAVGLALGVTGLVAREIRRR